MSESEQPINILTWNDALEQYLVDISEKCQGYAWCHKKSETMYSHRTIFLDLPQIIIGSINGFLSVGSKQIFDNDSYAPIYIGMVSLFVSLLNTINSYFSWNRRAEQHKLASNAYSKLYRMIHVEMSTKPRGERMPPHKLLDYITTQYNQLAESSPLLPPGIIKLFNERFGQLKDFSHPEECNGLNAVYPYKEPSFVVPPNSPVLTSSGLNESDNNKIHIRIPMESVDDTIFNKNRMGDSNRITATES